MASAQSTPWTDRAYLDVNGGLKASPSSFTDTARPLDFVEPATIDTSYKVKAAPEFDVGGGVRVWRSLALGLDVSRLSKTDAAAVSAQVPHPFYFGRPRAVAGSTNASRVETAVHIQAVWVMPMRKQWQIAIAGGPSFFNVQQDVVQDVTVDQTYPYDTATFASAVSTKQKKSAAGFNAGIDLTRMFSPRVGVGVGIGFSHAGVTLASGAGSSPNVDAGGAFVTGGLRLRFAGGGASAPAAPRTPRANAPSTGTSGGRWEIEGHAGGAFESSAAGGTSSLPPAGAAFTTYLGLSSRRASSWYFGDGAVLMNQILASFRSITATGRITSLDPALTQAGASRSSGAGFGFRVGRAITPRFGAEFTLDAARAPLKLTDALRSSVETSRASFIDAWNDRTGVINTGGGVVFTNPSVTSVSSFDDERGRRVFATGALTVNLVTRGRLTPYVTAGAGLVANTGGAPSATVTGNYRFTSLNAAAPGTFQVDETDSVAIRIVPTRDRAPVGVFGGGVRIAGSPRWGIRADVRAYVGTNTIDTLVDATPRVATATPSGYIASTLTPSLQFSNNPSTGQSSTLSGPPIAGFRTFAGSETAPHVVGSVGYFVRF